LPALAVLAGRRWSLLGRANFWAIPVVVFTVCAPWYVLQWQMVRYASEPIPPANAWISVTQANAALIVNQVGWVPLFMASLGLYKRVLRPEDKNGLWCSLFALGAAVWIFHSVLYPAVDDRYFIAGFAVLALFSAAGLHWLALSARWLYGDDPAFSVRLAACAVALFAFATSAVPVKAARGFAEAADFMLSEPLSDDMTALVSSDPIGEGAFIAHIATREPRPRRIILRGSKVLAAGTWMGLNYLPRYPDASSLLLALDRARVEYIAIDDATHEEHHRQLDATIRHSTGWAVMQLPSTSPEASRVRLYRRTRPLPPGRPEFELDMSYSLGTTLRP